MTFSFEPKPPKEAFQFWKEKVPMNWTTFSTLAEDERVRAFVISGMAKGDMLTAMHKSIEKALEEGQSMGKWKRNVNTLFEKNGWDKLQGWRLDNIFRTNIQTAYSIGRYNQMMRVVESRPYWRYSAINDSRTRLAHAALHGRVVRADDPFWDVMFPPNGYRCRCTVTSLSERDLERKGYNVENIKPGDPLEIPDGPQKGRVVNAMPDPNFDTNAAKTYWKADLGRYRADVKELVLKDITKACPDEFCGPCEFAETDCFKRLKRHLTQTDLEDLQTVVWAENKKVQEGFSRWAEKVVKERVEIGELYPVGILPTKVLRHLATYGIAPRLALVVVDDERIKHLSRPDKKNRGQTLTLEEIISLPERFATADWYEDLQRPGLLMTWIQEGGKWVKLTISLDFKAGKKKSVIANSIRTAGVVEDYNIEKHPRYRKVE